MFSCYCTLHDSTSLIKKNSNYHLPEHYNQN